MHAPNPHSPILPGLLEAVLSEVGGGLPIWDLLSGSREDRQQVLCSRAALRATSRTLSALADELVRELRSLVLGMEGRISGEDEGLGVAGHAPGPAPGAASSGAGHKDRGAANAQEMCGGARAAASAKGAASHIDDDSHPAGAHQLPSSSASTSTGSMALQAAQSSRWVVFTDDSATWPPAQQRQQQRVHRLLSKLVRLESVCVQLTSGGMSQLMRLLEEGSLPRSVTRLEVTYRISPR